MAYTPSGKNNKRNPYYKKQNHVKLSRRDETKKSFSGAPVDPDATAPAAFAVGDWALTSGPSPRTLVLDISALPSDGGSAITSLQYQIGAGSWTALSGTGTGARTLTMAAAGTSYSINVRAVNAAGNGAASTAKTATSGAATAPGAFSADDWSVETRAIDGGATIRVFNLPPDNGSNLIRLRYTTNLGGPWTPFAEPAATGDHPITLAQPDTAFGLRIGAANGVGGGPQSETKTVTSGVSPQLTATLLPNPPVEGELLTITFSATPDSVSATLAGAAVTLAGTGTTRTITPATDGTLVVTFTKAGYSNSPVTVEVQPAQVEPGGATLEWVQQPAATRIYQRDAETGGAYNLGAGMVPVVVSANETPVGVQYRLRDANAPATTLVDWAAVSASGPNTALTINVPVPARLGDYLLDLRDGSGGEALTGDNPFGMGRVVFVSGQSLAVRLFGKMPSDTGTNASLGVTVPANASVCAVYDDTSRPHLTLNWARPADGGDYDSTFASDFLRRQTADHGVSCALVGHTRGATAIAPFIPGGNQSAKLHAAAAAAGGWEAFIWVQGHSDAKAGTTAADYAARLQLLADDLTAINARGADYQVLLCAIPRISSGSWGTAAQIGAIRQAHIDWANANGAIYSQPMDLMLIDGVHQSQAGNLQLSRRFSDALAGRPDTFVATDNAITFATSTPGFGQALTGGNARVATINGVSESAIWAAEGRISLSAVPTAIKVAFGQGGMFWVGTDATGKLIGNYNNVGANVRFTLDFPLTIGQVYHVEIAATPTGALLFVDGLLVSSTTTPPVKATQTGAQTDFCAGSFVANLGSYAWPGTVDEVALWAYPRHTSAFTVPAAPYTGVENGLLLLLHLDGSADAVRAA